MKTCGSCNKQYEEWRTRCPYCGETLAIQTWTAGEAVRAFEAMEKRAEAGKIVDKGAKLFFKAELGQAEKLFKQAIQLDPHNAPAHGNMGHVFMKRGKYAEAIPWLEKALALDPYIEGVPAALEQCKAAAKQRDVSISNEDAEVLKQAGIEFTHKSTLMRDFGSRLGPIECTYEYYKADSVEKAIAFLNSRTVSQNYYYIEIRTPLGLVGKDIKGIYKEWET